MTQKQPPRQIPARLPPLSNTNPSPLSSSAARWRAVVTRDTTANNTFVYGVRTTGIYCRPSCPARLARRANIEFYDSAAQAEAAGFRPCKRCRPHLHVTVDPQVRLVQKACETIASLSVSGQKPKLQELAAEANLTPSHFHRVFKKVVGVTPGQYAKDMWNRNLQGEKTSRSSARRSEETCSSKTAEDLDLFDLCAPNETNEVLHDSIDWNGFDAMIAAENDRDGTQCPAESEEDRLPTLCSPSCLKIDSQTVGADLSLGDNQALVPTQLHESGGELAKCTDDIDLSLELWKDLESLSSFSWHISDHNMCEVCGLGVQLVPVEGGESSSISNSALWFNNLDCLEPHETVIRSP
ncbi:hypothetical protein M432DRAFT_282770 [Thermoascus aurantiacus ATCC 26904]